MGVLNLCVWTVEPEFRGAEVHRLAGQILTKSGPQNQRMLQIFFLGDKKDLPKVGQFIACWAHGTDKYELPVVISWKQIAIPAEGR